ncbi:MAG: hypothetical protein OSB65_16675 [Roseibacillus sp.]|nr:hypothetical protein [Roseibacillus sp.]
MVPHCFTAEFDLDRPGGCLPDIKGEILPLRGPRQGEQQNGKGTSAEEGSGDEHSHLG